MRLLKLIILMFCPLLMCSCTLCAVFLPVKLHPTKDTHNPQKVYVPKNVFDAVAELQKSTTWYERMAIKHISEEDMCVYHFTIGRWIRNFWIRTDGPSPLDQYFRVWGIGHPDTMSGIILVAFWCQLHHKELHRQGTIDYFLPKAALDLSLQEASQFTVKYWLLDKKPDQREQFTLVFESKQSGKSFILDASGKLIEADAKTIERAKRLKQ